MDVSVTRLGLWASRVGKPKSRNILAQTAPSAVVQAVTTPTLLRMKQIAVGLQQLVGRVQVPLEISAMWTAQIGGYVTTRRVSAIVSRDTGAKRATPKVFSQAKRLEAQESRPFPHLTCFGLSSLAFNP